MHSYESMFVSTNNTNDCTGMCNELGEDSTFYTKCPVLLREKVESHFSKTSNPACVLEM